MMLAKGMPVQSIANLVKEHDTRPGGFRIITYMNRVIVPTFPL